MSHHCTRRDFLRLGVGGLLAARLRPLFGQENAPVRAKNCIVLWMDGGPSHVDTWDLKKDNGPFKAIETAAKGVWISEHLPLLAKQAKDLAVIRSVTSVEADHERAVYYLHTGNRPKESVAFPTLGAIASKEWPAAAELPGFVWMSDRDADPGFLGLEHAPFVVDPDQAVETLKAPGGPARMNKRVDLLKAMNQAFSTRSDPVRIGTAEKVQKRALAMMNSKAVRAFDIDREDQKVRAAYGDSTFGRGCLLARLIEHGVRFVEVALDNWDTHTDNFNKVKTLAATLDAGMATLLRELGERKLLNETLVLWMGEFGRTPKINKDNGRDHHSKAFSVVLAGGGIQGGQTIGKSDASGAEVAERPVTIPDLYASIFQAFGFDPAKNYTTEGRPVKLVDNGKVVTELFK